MAQEDPALRELVLSAADLEQTAATMASLAPGVTCVDVPHRADRDALYALAVRAPAWFPALERVVVASSHGPLRELPYVVPRDP
ncbi:MAG: hypothetical protein KF773_03460 [Deltaproteobacteria bacterium]|nr:hypothetical protein [Deltaproteobacteria bacterium]